MRGRFSGGGSKTIIRLVAIVVLILMMAWVGMLPQVAPALADTTDSVQVSINTVNVVTPDVDFTLTVEISLVENFDACNYNVSFDPTVLSLDSVTSGDISGTVIPVDIWNERSPGTVTIIHPLPEPIQRA